MPSTRRQEQLFQNVVRLRDVQRRREDVEVALVLADLERELGPTVSRNLAAKLLGISHTGLQRWVESGDVPVVVDGQGRTAVPVSGLLRLHDQLREQREKGVRRLHFVEPVAMESRKRALQVATMQLDDGDDDDQGHGRATRRARAVHRVIARRLRRVDVVDARAQLARWSAEGRIAPIYADAWRRQLSLPLVELKQVLVDDSPEADDLRQNSPLAGLLSEPERRAIFIRVR